MRVELNEAFWKEIQAHYAKGMNVEEFNLGDIHCWAFTASGTEFPGVEHGARLFEFCKPFGIPVYAYVNEDVQTPNLAFDTVEYAFVKVNTENTEETMEIVKKCSQEVKDNLPCETEDCSC